MFSCILVANQNTLRNIHISGNTSPSDFVNNYTFLYCNAVCVVSSDTVSRSGMFCAIATTIERCKTEGVVDVFQVVKALRVQKPGAVRTVVRHLLSL